jgi:hypothetical protein
MAVADLNETRIKDLLPDGLPENVPGTTSPDSPSLLHAGTPPLTTYVVQQSRDITESKALTRTSNGHTNLYSLLQTVRLPSLSGVFNYILKRAAFIPSVLYRKLDLPWFRQSRRTGQDSIPLSKKTPVMNTSSPQKDGVYTATPIPSPDVQTSKGYLFEAPEESGQNIIGNLASLEMSSGEEFRTIPVPPVLSPETIMPSVSRQVNSSYQREEVNDTVIPDEFETNTSVQIELPIIKSRQSADRRQNTSGNAFNEVVRRHQAIRQSTGGSKPAAVNRAGDSKQPHSKAVIEEISSITDPEQSHAISDTNLQQPEKAGQSSPEIPGNTPDTASDTTLEVKTASVTQVNSNIPGETPRPSIVHSPESLKRQASTPPVDQQSDLSRKTNANSDAVSRTAKDAIQSTGVRPKTVKDNTSDRDTPTTGESVPENSTFPGSSVVEDTVDKRPLQRSLPQDTGQSIVQETGTVPYVDAVKTAPTLKPVTSMNVGQPPLSRKPVILDNISSKQSSLKGSSVPEDPVTYYGSPTVETAAERTATAGNTISTDIILKKYKTALNDSVPGKIQRTATSDKASTPGKSSMRLSPPETVTRTDESPTGAVISQIDAAVNTSAALRTPSVDKPLSPEPSTTPAVEKSLSPDDRIRKAPASQGKTSVSRTGAFPHRGTPEPTATASLPGMKRPDTPQLVPQTEREPGTIPLPEVNNNIFFDRDTNGTIAPNYMATDNSRQITSTGNTLLYRKIQIPDKRTVPVHTHTGNISDAIAEKVQRISGITGYAPGTERTQTQLQDSNSVAVPLDFYRNTGQQLLDLPVASSPKPVESSNVTHSGEISRAVAGTAPELPYSHIFNTSEPGKGQVARMIEAPVPVQAEVIQRAEEPGESRETSPDIDIRVLADKVYTILRRDLKIERERNRHQRLR